MLQADPQLLAAIDGEALRLPVATLLGRDDARVEDWEVQPLASPLKPFVTVYRLNGMVQTPAGQQPWTLVLKVLPPRGDGGHIHEARVYGSGLLDRLPEGLAAPRLLGLEARPGGTLWLWLEALDEGEPEWPVARYALAARHLGRMAGTFVDGVSLPSDLPLPGGWLSDWLEAARPAMALLPRVGEQALVREAFPPPLAAAIGEVWREREVLYGALDALPRTLCHHDPHRHNMISRPTAGPDPETVLLDWQFAGLGPPGTDAAPLVGGSLTELLVEPHQAHALESAVLAGYRAGLEDAGHDALWPAARLGYAATSALRYTVGAVRFLLPALVDERQTAQLEQLMHRDAGEIARHTAALLPFFLSLHEQSLALIRSPSLR